MKHITAVLFTTIAITGCATRADGPGRVVCADGATDCASDPRRAEATPYVDALGFHDFDELTLVNASSADDARAIAASLSPSNDALQLDYYGCSAGPLHGACCWDQDGYIKCVGW